MQDTAKARNRSSFASGMETAFRSIPERLYQTISLAVLVWQQPFSSSPLPATMHLSYCFSSWGTVSLPEITAFYGHILGVHGSLTAQTQVTCHSLGTQQKKPARMRNKKGWRHTALTSGRLCFQISASKSQLNKQLHVVCSDLTDWP